MTLYELTEQFQQLLDLAQDPEIDPEVIQDTMEGLTGEIEVKAEGYVIVMKDLDAVIEKVTKEIDRLNGWRESVKNNKKRMSERLMESMNAIGKDRLQTEHFKLSIAKNGGLKPMKITGDVPLQYCRLEPDNKLIREALDKGEELSFAHFEDRGVYLSVR